VCLSVLQYQEFNETRLPWVTKAVFVAFAVLVPILLINMLIAMMANTYEQIIRRAEKEWKRQVGRSARFSWPRRAAKAAL